MCCLFPWNYADIDQLKRIMEVVGTPSSELLKKISSEHVSSQLHSVNWLSVVLSLTSTVCHCLGYTDALIWKWATTLKLSLVFAARMPLFKKYAFGGIQNVTCINFDTCSYLLSFCKELRDLSWWSFKLLIIKLFL